MHTQQRTPHTAGLSSSLPVYFTSFHPLTLRPFVCAADLSGEPVSAGGSARDNLYFHYFTVLWGGGRSATVATLAYLGGRLQINRKQRPEVEAWRWEEPVSHVGPHFEVGVFAPSSSSSSRTPHPNHPPSTSLEVGTDE